MLIDVLKYIDGIDVKQNGQRGQLASLFTRGTNSNHTLVLLNGIPINDQSTTQGLHNFGQDFLQTIQQIEIYTRDQMVLILDHLQLVGLLILLPLLTIKIEFL